MIKRIGWVVLGLTLAGCGSTEMESAAEDGTASNAAVDSQRVGPELSAENTVRVAPETLNEFVTRDERLSFLHVAGDSPTFLVAFEHSSFISEGLLESLTREHPGLTLLEMFYALAPAGEVPHAALVEYHAEQADGQGRSDHAVRRVEFDVNRLVEKSAAGCTNYTKGLTPAGQTWETNRLNAVSKPNGGNLGLLCAAWQGLAGCNHQDLTGTHIVAACNEGPSQTAHWWAYQRNSSPWVESTLHYILPPKLARGFLLPEHSSGLFNDWQVMGILSEDIHLAGEQVPSYHARAGHSRR